VAHGSSKATRDRCLALPCRQPVRRMQPAADLLAPLRPVRTGHESEVWACGGPSLPRRPDLSCAIVGTWAGASPGPTTLDTMWSRQHKVNLKAEEGGSRTWER